MFLFLCFLVWPYNKHLINRARSVCMGESWPRSLVQTSLRSVCTGDLGQDSPIQTSRVPIGLKAKLSLTTCTILVKTFGTLCVLGEENVIQVDPPTPWTVLGVTSQTTFTYLANVKDIQFVHGEGVGEKLQVSCEFHTKTREKGEVYQNLLVRIVDTYKNGDGNEDANKINRSN